MTKAGRVLLTGATGQLGQTLKARWTASPAVAERDLICAGSNEFDVGDGEAVNIFLETNPVAVIINAAAYTAVDDAEDAPEAAYRVNERGPANLAAWAVRNDARLIQLSTDFVFDGQQQTPYKPGDRPDPLSVYGGSKLAGEQAVLRADLRALVIRTSWLYSPFGKNFVKTMLRLMQEKDSLAVVKDQLGAPTSTDSLASLILAALERPEIGGVHHWSDEAEISWFEFALAIREEGLRYRLLDREIPIRSIPSSEYPTPAARPAYSVLDKKETAAAFNLEPLNWRDQLARVIQQLASMESGPT